MTEADASGPARPAPGSRRTWLCSIVFMDIAGYTRHPLSRQIAMKNRFSEITTRLARQHFQKDELFVVDAGDGGALCYLGDPEDMLFCARDLMAAFRAERDPPLPVRIGINLGPVRIHTNVAGQPNPIGDGINVAQRVMSFAEAGQILASRSFYEVVGCLSEEHSCLFEHVGERADKHVRRHDLYRVHGDGDEAPRDAPAVANDAAPAEGPAATPPLSASPCLLQKEMEQLLVERLGPMGRVLVRRAFRTGATPAEAVQALAGHLPAGGERDRFLARAEALLLRSHQAGDAPLAPRPPRRAAVHWNAAELDLAARHLVEFVGPMAPALVQRVACEARDLRGLYHGLARFIGRAAERERFLAEAGVDDGPD